MQQIREDINVNCCSIPRTILRFIMVSLYPHDSAVYKFFAIICFCLRVGYPINNTYLIIKNFDDFDLVAKTLFHANGGVILILKLVIFAINRQHINNVVEKVINLQKKTNTEKWSQKFVYNVNRLCLVFHAILFIGVVIFSLGTLLGRLILDDPTKWALPFSDVSFMDRSSFPYYEIAWLYQSISVVLVAEAFCLTDFLIIGLIADMVIQVKLIQKRIQATIREAKLMSEKQHDKEASWLYLREALKTIVQDHTFIIDLAMDIERVSNVLTMVTVLGNLGMICFSVYYVSVISLLDFRAFQVYIQLVGVITCIFFFSYWGTQLSLSSQAVGTACYNTNFWETDIRFQRGLQLVIMRSQKPITFTVGKFTILSTNIFVWILKNSYTFFMVLRKTNEGIETI